ncbi:hypothetical protein MRX96_014147 [Rhipicephalus microplus]
MPNPGFLVVVTEQPVLHGGSRAVGSESSSRVYSKFGTGATAPPQRLLGLRPRRALTDAISGPLSLRCAPSRCTLCWLTPNAVRLSLFPSHILLFNLSARTRLYPVPVRGTSPNASSLQAPLNELAKTHSIGASADERRSF